MLGQKKITLLSSTFPASCFDFFDIVKAYCPGHPQFSIKFLLVALNLPKIHS
jgi:hypothetical protein